MANKIKLNIGAGSTTYAGFINCDYSDQYNPDYVFDLEKDQWPFEDNSVTHVIAHHVLEHLGEGYFHALKELYRVCAPGASIDIRVPHYNNHNFYHDATHRRAITAIGLSMFSKKKNHSDFLNNQAMSRLGEYLNIDLELISYSYVVEDRYSAELADKSNEYIEEYSWEKNNVISEICIKMMAIKGTRAEQINAYYVNYLNRNADEAGLNHYLNSNLSMQEILNALKDSEEYRNRI
jgi:predicted SAM-dependent methyltransferase